MSIATRIESISNHLENAYDELQGLGADLTDVNKNVENISMVLNNIYDSMPQVSGEGASLTLDDTRVGKIKSTLKGNTSQNETPTPTTPIPVNVVSGDNKIVVYGKNLAHSENYDYTFNGVNSTCVNETFTYNGTSTGANNILPGSWNYYSLGIFEAGTYTFSFNYISGNVTAPSGGSDAFYVRVPSLSITKSTGSTQIKNNWSTTITLTEKAEIFIQHYVNTSGFVFSNFKYNIQLEKGTTATSYEPYQDKTYNIDLPVENLIDITAGERGEIDSDGNLIVNATNWRSTVFIPVQPSTKYIFSINGTINTIRIYEYDDNQTFISPRKIYTSYPFTFTTGANTKYVKYTIYNNVGDMTQEIVNNLKPQLELGSKVNTYTPYGTTPIELCSSQDETKRDYLLHDKTNDKWYLHKEIVKIILNGTEAWQRYYTSSVERYYYSPPNMTLIEDLGYCDYASIGLYVDRNNSANNNKFFIGNNTLQFRRDDLAGGTTVTAFKTWLSTHNTKVYCVLTTPTNIEITYQPLIDQLNELEKAISYENQTNISQINNDLPFIIKANALLQISD